MKKMNLFPVSRSSKSILLFLFIALSTGLFAQNWNFYFGSTELNSLSDNLKNSSLSYNYSTSVTGVGTLVGGVRPQLGRGDIVLDGNLLI